jgi:hypothetical protein
MNLAIINSETNIVENVIIPPKEGDTYTVASGFYSVLSDIASIGDTYENDEFIKPELPEQDLPEEELPE